MADDWTIIGPDGGVSDKPTFLELLRSGILTHELMDFEDTVVRIYGDAGVVMGRAVFGGAFRGQKFRVTERVSDVFVRKNGQ